MLDCLKLCCAFPVNSIIYIMAPHSDAGRCLILFVGFDFKSRFMRNPFVKFISHSASYMFFLTLLALASQRFEYMLISIVLFFFPDIEVTLKWN